MQDELNNFKRNRIQELVCRPKKCSTIGTKLVFRKKLNEYGIITKNKVKLVAQDYNQEDGIDYNKTFTLVGANASSFCKFQKKVNFFLNGC